MQAWPGKDDTRRGTITWQDRSRHRWSWFPSVWHLKHWHVLLAVLGGAVTYALVLLSLGGLHRTRLWRSALHATPVSTTAPRFLGQPAAIAGLMLSRDRRSPMKFCMVTTFFGGHSFGGDAAYVDRLCQALCRRGHEVHVYYCVDAFNAVRGNHPLREYTPTTWPASPSAGKRVWHCSRRWRPRRQVCHCSSHGPCGAVWIVTTPTSCTFTISRSSEVRASSDWEPIGGPSES